MIIIHWFYIVPFLVPKDAMDETKTEYGKQKDKKAQKSMLCPPRVRYLVLVMEVGR